MSRLARPNGNGEAGSPVTIQGGKNPFPDASSVMREAACVQGSRQSLLPQRGKSCPAESAEGFSYLLHWCCVAASALLNSTRSDDT